MGRESVRKRECVWERVGESLGESVLEKERAYGRDSVENESVGEHWEERVWETVGEREYGRESVGERVWSSMRDSECV